MKIFRRTSEFGLNNVSDLKYGLHCSLTQLVKIFVVLNQIYRYVLEKK